MKPKFKVETRTFFQIKLNLHWVHSNSYQWYEENFQKIYMHTLTSTEALHTLARIWKMSNNRWMNKEIVAEATEKVQKNRIGCFACSRSGSITGTTYDPEHYWEWSLTRESGVNSEHHQEWPIPNILKVMVGAERIVQEVRSCRCHSHDSGSYPWYYIWSLHTDKLL